MNKREDLAVYCEVFLTFWHTSGDDSKHGRLQPPDVNIFLCSDVFLVWATAALILVSGYGWGLKC